jgi:hypothetical protein
MTKSNEIGYKLVKVSATFTRPADTTAYAVGDSISNSTSAPLPFELDLAEYINGGGSLEVRKIAIVSSIKQATLPLINVFLCPETFTATNDNAALDISDTIQENGGGWLNCEVQNYTASNSRVAYVGIPMPIVMPATSQKLYGALQAANAYTPGNAEKFTIVAWIAIL